MFAETGTLYRNVAKAVLLILYSAAAVRAQTSDERAREAAREAVQVSTERANSFFSVHRREDLEEVFLSVRFFQGGRFERDPQIFEVTDGGYEFKNGSIDYHLSVHGPFLYFVAVANAPGGVFRIGGFKDSQSEFSRLAKYYNVKLRSEFQAQEYAGLYLRLDPAHYQLVQTTSLLQLKQLAEREFDDNYKGFSSGETRLNQWWAKHESALSRMSFKQTTTAVLEGFEVSFLTLSSIDDKSQADGPTPLRVTLTLTKDGQIAQPTLTPLKFE